MTTDGRVRLSCGSVLRQTSHSQPIMGTPALVPVPRKSNSTELIERSYNRRPRETKTDYSDRCIARVDRRPSPRADDLAGVSRDYQYGPVGSRHQWGGDRRQWIERNCLSQG